MLRTPAMRELLRTALAPGGATGRGVTAVLLAQDPELALGAALRVAAATGALHEALGEVIRHAGQLPPAVQGELAAAVLEALRLDHLRESGVRALQLLARLMTESEVARERLAQELARQVNALLAELAAHQGSDAQRIGQPIGALVGALLPHLDAGLLREALEALAAAVDGTSDETLARWVGDPVLVANLVSAQPALVNSALLLTARALEGLRLPPEVLAGALFNVLDEVEPRRAARLLGAAGRLVSALHEGNLILGGHEPRLRRAAVQWARDLLPALDRDALAAAAAALGEDIETLLRAAGDLARYDPAAARGALLGALAFAEAAARGVLALARDIEELPDAELEPLRQRIARSSLPALFGELAEVLARAAARLPGGAGRIGSWLAIRLLSAWCAALERDEHAVEAAVHAAVQGVGEQRAAAAVERSLTDLGRAVREHPLLLGAVVRPLGAGARYLLVSSVRDLGDRLRRRVGRAPAPAAATGRPPAAPGWS